MATIFAAFGKAVGNNKGSIQNFGIVGITIASEEISKFIFFFCPCDYPRNQTYGSVFIWGPAIVLLIAGYLANRRTWRLTTGLCKRTQPLFRGGKRVIHFLFTFGSIGFKSMIAPATWVVLAFLKGDYYACAHWPDPDNYVGESRQFYKLNELNPNISLPKPCMFNPNPAKFKGDVEAEVIARTLRAESHIIGWFYLTLGMLVSVTLMFFMRCQSNFSYEQSNYIARYREHEIELFEEQLDEKAKIQAERIVNGYFSKTRAKEEWDKIAVINDKVTHSKRGRAIYSPLHRFVNKEKLKEEEGFADGDIVQDAATRRKLLKHTKKVPKSSGGADASIPATQFLPMVAPPPQKVVVKSTLPLNSQHQPVTGISNIATSSPHHSTLPSDQKDKKVPSDKTILPEKSLQSPTEATTSKPPTTEQDLHTSPPEIESKLLVASSLAIPKQPIAPSSQSLSSAPAIPPPPKKERPQSLPPCEKDPLSQKDATVKETSLGDFGGYYSREDLRKSLSGSEESVDGPETTNTNRPNDSSDVEISDQMEEDKEGYTPLLENTDDIPLL